MVRQTVQHPQTISRNGWSAERNNLGIPEVEPLWVATQNLGVRLVDVRNLEEYTNSGGHVVGAELVPVSALEQLAQEWDPNAPCVLICNSGQLSAEAAQMLEDMDFTKVASMRGGMSTWNKLRFPVSQHIQ